MKERGIRAERERESWKDIGKEGIQKYNLDSLLKALIYNYSLRILNKKRK